MARSRSRIPLNVLLNGRLVGCLQRHPNGAIEFQYDHQWLTWDHTFPISLSLPLREDRYVGAAVTAVFDNLLPDSDAIRRRLAEQARAEGADFYSLLAAIGRDCVGALQFLPADLEPEPVGNIFSTPITEEKIADIITNLGKNPLGVSKEGDFRISLAGAQEKTALLKHEEKWQIPLGTTATTHILKPQIGKRPDDGLDFSRSVENEHLCMMLTKAMGLPTAHSEIADFAGQRVLMVKRFDRRWTQNGRLLRLPLEDCCQALGVPPTRKYEADGGPGIRQITVLLKGSDNPASYQAIFLKAQIVFWLLAVTDGHAKNFSIFIGPGGRFTLSPLYDVISAQPFFDTGQIRRNQLNLAMAVGKNRHYVIQEIRPRHFLQTAKASDYPINAVRRTMAEIHGQATAALDQVRNSLPSTVPEDLADSILTGFCSRLAHLKDF